MHNHFLFLWNVIVHLVASMSGIVSFLIAIYEAINKKQVASRTFFGIGVLFLVVACDQAWQDEHRNTQILIGEKATLWQDRDFWKDQSYQKDTSLRSRDELLNKNFTALLQTQSSLASLSNRLMDVTGPNPAKLDTRRWKIPVTYTYANVGKVQFWTIIVVSNRVISPAKGTLKCDADFQIVETNIVTHGSTLRAAYDTISTKEVHVDFVYPPLSADNPLVFSVFTKEGTEINDCSFAPDK